MNIENGLPIDPTLSRQRRAFLMAALSNGALIGGLGWNQAALAGWFGKTPKPMPAGHSIFDMRGKVLINGRNAQQDQLISGNDRIEVGRASQLIYAVGNNAYVVREKTILEMQGRDLFVDAMRLISGAMLGVFGKRKKPLTLATNVVTIGIRGTAVYTRAYPDRTYACTCYGETRIQSVIAQEQFEDIQSKHHDAPRWILNGKQGANNILPAPMFDHDDMELAVIEALCGRTPPFATPSNSYGGPRRPY